MEDLPRFAERLDTDRLHQAAAIGRSITRVDINMLTIQAAWTVIGIPCPLDGRATMSADKIFGVSLKPLYLKFFLHTPSISL